MTTATTMTELLASDEAAKRIDGLRKYRARLKDAAGVEQLDAAQAGKLAELAQAAGIDEAQIAGHLGAVSAHQTYTARIKELQAEVPAADRKRKTLLVELQSLNDKLNELRAAIRATHRPALEESHLIESVRRLTTKHAAIFNAEAVR